MWLILKMWIRCSQLHSGAMLCASIWYRGRGTGLCRGIYTGGSRQPCKICGTPCWMPSRITICCLVCDFGSTTFTLFAFSFQLLPPWRHTSRLHRWWYTGSLIIKDLNICGIIQMHYSLLPCKICTVSTHCCCKLQFFIHGIRHIAKGMGQPLFQSTMLAILPK